MKAQTLFNFEQTIVDAEQAAADAELQAKLAAKAAAAHARAEAKRKEESEKLSRRLAREAAYRRKRPPGYAQCGINWYPAGSGWTHCHKCGQELVYTTDPNAPPQECKRRSILLSTLNSQPSTPLNTTDPNAKPQECPGRRL